MRTLGSIVLAIALVGGSARANDDGWKAIGLQWELFEGLASPQRCTSNQALFFSCINGFRAALKAVEGDAWDVWPSAQKTAPSPSATTLGRLTFGPLTPAVSWRSAASRYAHARTAIAAWRSEFGLAGKSSIKKDLAAMARHLGKKVGASGQASKNTALAVQGFLRSYQDPFARLVPTARDDAQLASTGVAQVDVGLKPLRVGRAHVIEAVAPGSPAAKAGVRRGALVVQVDGWPAANLSGPAVNRLLQGAAGTAVVLTLLRGGKERRLTLVRSAYELRHVRHDVFEGPTGSVGWVQIRSFHSNHVCSQTRAALEALATQKVSALLVDVRGNAGGLIDQAVCVAGLLMGPGVTVTSLKSPRQEARYNKTYVTAQDAAMVVSAPMAVLVDARSQSAAELLAGALRIAGRALLVGQRTYGKGSVQDAHEWAKGVAVALYKEVAHYVVADSHPLHLRGVAPDVVVNVTGKSVASPAVRADLRYLAALREPPATDAQTTLQPAPCLAVDAGVPWRSRGEMGRLTLDPQLHAALGPAKTCGFRRPAAKAAP